MSIIPNRRIFRIGVLLVTLVTISGFAELVFGQVFEPSENLSSYLREAQANNTDLESLLHQIEVAQHRLPRAGAWQDPTVSIGMMNLPVNSLDFNQEPMTGLWINASQMIPLAGKIGLKTEIADQNLTLSNLSKTEKELMIGSALAQTWYDWAYLNATLETLDKNIELIDDLIVTTTTKYETGKGMQQDILRTQTKRTQLENMRENVLQMRLTNSRKFASLLGRANRDGLKEPADLQNTFSELRKDILVEELLQSNPGLQKTRTEIDIASAQSNLAKQMWYPDLKVGAGYGFRQNANNGTERPDFFTVTAGISVPIFGSRKQGEAVQEMQAMEQAAKSKLKSMNLDLKFQLEKLLDEDDRLAKQIELYEDGIEPQAEATLAASTSSYAVGKADFESLLMAEAMLYNARLELLARVRDRLKVRVSLAALVADEALMKENSK